MTLDFPLQVDANDHFEEYAVVTRESKRREESLLGKCCHEWMDDFVEDRENADIWVGRKR